MTASVNFTYGLPGELSKVREHLEAIQTLVAGINAGTTAFDDLAITDTLTNTGKLLTDANGNVTMPGQPGFAALQSILPVPPGTAHDMTGDETPFIWSTERYDNGGDYNVSTGIFTAPKDGKYFFSVLFEVATRSGTPASFASIIFNHSGTEYPIRANFQDSASNTLYRVASGAIMVDMDENDTMRINVEVDSSSHTWIHSVNMPGHFIGHLIS